jgi:putative ABC transport system permease protein
VRPFDLFGFALQAARGYPARTLLSLLAMAIGVGAVVLLTSLGEGARLYVQQQFMSLGTHLIIVLPGRNETTGGPPPLLGTTPRDLTLTDSLALLRSRKVAEIAPVTIGSANVSWRQREREVVILGTTSGMQTIRQLTMAQGKFLPRGNPGRATPVCVLGHSLRQELFGNNNALGQWLRIGDRRFRVIGVMSEKGTSLGLDMGDIVLVPVASAQSLFNVSGLFRIMVQARERDEIEGAKKAIIDIIKARHDGDDDVTVITQDAMLATFDTILRTLTYTVGGIGGVSLLVAGILIMNVMLISVSQRSAEIALLKAIGGTSRQILLLILTEALLLALLGSGVGVAIAYGGNLLAVRLYPEFPATVPWWSLVAGVGVALLTSLVFGGVPARRGARLDPVLALARR